MKVARPRSCTAPAERPCSSTSSIPPSNLPRRSESSSSWGTRPMRCAQPWPLPASASSSRPNRRAPATPSWSAAMPLAHLDGYLMVLYGDCPLLRTGHAAPSDRAARPTALPPAVLLTAEMDDPTGYGRVIRDARGRRCSTSWSRRPPRPEQLAIREANMGIYCFRADLFWKHVQEIGPTTPRTNTTSPTWALYPDPRRPRRGGHAHRRSRAKLSASTIARSSPRWTPSSANASCSAVMLAGVTIEQSPKP